eukprot:2786006-Pyramimonas_sp.AAC.1
MSHRALGIYLSSLLYELVARLNHLLRNLPPNKVQPLAMAHYAAILQAFRDLLGLPLCGNGGDAW